MIYLTLHMTETEQRIKEFAEKYNAKMKLTNKDNAGKLTLKKTHIETAKQLAKILQIHLKKQSQFRTNNSEDGILVNNVALGTLLGQSRRASYDQLKRLQQSGIIQYKVFRGSNASYRIVLNPELLVAFSNYQFTCSLIEYFVQNAPENIKYDPEIIEKLNSAKPDFAVFLGGNGKFLPHIAIRTLQDLKINMNKGIIVENVDRFKKLSNNSKNKVSKPTSLKNVFINNDVLAQDQLQEPLHDHPLKMNDKFKERNAAPTKNVIPLPEKIKENHQVLAENSKQSHIRHLVLSSWAWLISHLYGPDRFFTDHDKGIAISFLQLYYENNSATASTVNQAFYEFCTRVLLARKYILKSPGRFIPNPRIWLDPTFTNGFTGTKDWLIKVKQKQEIDKEYYSNIKLVAQFYKNYTLNPTMESYSSATQRLSKIKNKDYLNLFNEAVLSRNPKYLNYDKVF